MRSATLIASSWSWVTMTKVSPSFACRSISSKRVSSRSFRSSAASGSSSSSTRGRLTRRGRARRAGAGRRRAGAACAAPALPACTSASISATRAAISAFGKPSCFRPKAMLSSTVRCGKQRVALEHHVDRPPVRRHARRCLRHRAECGPASGVSKPASMRNSVVLPQPEGPSSAKNSPSKMSSERLSTATDAGKAFGDRLEPHQRRRRAGIGGANGALRAGIVRTARVLGGGLVPWRHATGRRAWRSITLAGAETQLSGASSVQRRASAALARQRAWRTGSPNNLRGCGP